MHELITLAVGQTLGFSGWKYANEFEFKHELFHHLASLPANGIGLAQQVPSTPSCRLHAEGKVLNGYARKADLLICDPHRRQSFNYEVEYVIELKRALTADLVGVLDRRWDMAARFENVLRQARGRIADRCRYSVL